MNFSWGRKNIVLEEGKRAFAVRYEVEISENAEKSLEKISKRDRLKIIEKIDELEKVPMLALSIKLQGYKEVLYRKTVSAVFPFHGRTGRKSYLTPTLGFRSTYTYQNVIYVTEDEISEAVSGITWDEFIKTNIFDPLGQCPHPFFSF